MNALYSEIEVKKKLLKSIAITLKNDSFLLQNDLSEMTICHRLAFYLESEFKGYHVDCEYNRHLLDLKLLDEYRNPDGSLVLPDIIIHHRGTDSQNLLVIEMKKSKNRSVNLDTHKIKLFKTKLNYQYGVSLIIDVGYSFGFQDPIWVV